MDVDVNAGDGSGPGLGTGLDPDTFRAVLGRFASGVTVVTCIDADGRDMGMTVSAFCSLSLDPPLVLICIDHAASVHHALVNASFFAVNVLSDHQEAIARRFAESDGHRFQGIGMTRGEHGLALLHDTLATLECRRVTQYEGGDHTIVLGHVEHAQVYDARPLLYYRGGYAQLGR